MFCYTPKVSGYDPFPKCDNWHRSLIPTLVSTFLGPTPLPLGTDDPMLHHPRHLWIKIKTVQLGEIFSDSGLLCQRYRSPDLHQISIHQGPGKTLHKWTKGTTDRDLVERTWVVVKTLGLRNEYGPVVRYRSLLISAPEVSLLWQGHLSLTQTKLVWVRRVRSVGCIGSRVHRDSNLFTVPTVHIDPYKQLRRRKCRDGLRLTLKVK